MDKFGIFKLLNSFFNLYGQKTPDSTTTGSSKVNDSSSMLNDLLKSLGNQTNNQKNNEQVKNPASKPKQHPTVPLQASMLKTMSSHDQFIARVKQKNLQ